MYQMLWPIRYTVAGILLLSPGFVSTIIALLLLLPIKGRPAAQMNTQSFRQQTFTRRTEDDGDIIEGEYTVTRADPQTKHQDYIEHKRD